MGRQLLSGVLLAALTCGCTAFHEYKQDQLMSSRNRQLARQAWAQQGHCYVDHNCYDDFGSGFIDGYYDVASGGKGCKPAFPPKYYWNIEFQCPEGQQRIECWFEGFAAGAAQAKKDCVSQISMLPTSLKLPQNTHATAPLMPVAAPGVMPALPNPVPPVAPQPPVNAAPAPAPRPAGLGEDGAAQVMPHSTLNSTNSFAMPGLPDKSIESTPMPRKLPDLDQPSPATLTGAPSSGEEVWKPINKQSK